MTGFLGGAAAVELLVREPSRILLLVRADSDEAARCRIRRSLLRFVAAEDTERFLKRCEVIRGDITDADTMADARFDDVTHALHLAANTSFRSVRGVRHTNIVGTLALAHRLRRARRLERFLFVGTAHICGLGAPRVVHERDFPRVGVRYPAEYAASKAEAEQLLEATAPELPLVVARPSVVAGHSRLGCSPSASLFWYYRTLCLLGCVPVSPESYRDIVPVDFAAEALTRLLLAPTLRHNRYHVSAGETSSVSWQEMADAFAAGRGEPASALRLVDEAGLAAERPCWASKLGPGDEDRLLSMLTLYFRFGTSGVEWFDNSRLLEEGCPPPPRFTEYIRRCLETSAGRSVYEQMMDDV